MGAEIIGRHLEGFSPARDTFGQWPVNILKGLFGGGVASLAHAVENPARDHFLISFVAEKGIFEGNMFVGRIEPHGFGKLIARSLVVADFQQGVSQIFSYRGAVRRQRDGLSKSGDGLVVILETKRVVGLLERLICGIGALCWRK